MSQKDTALRLIFHDSDTASDFAFAAALRHGPHTALDEVRDVVDVEEEGRYVTVTFRKANAAEIARNISDFEIDGPFRHASSASKKSDIQSELIEAASQRTYWRADFSQPGNPCPMSVSSLIRAVEMRANDEGEYKIAI